MEQEPIIKTVCGGILTEPEKYPVAGYKGERLYFCTHACLRAFEGKPDGFLKAEVEHPSEED